MDKEYDPFWLTIWGSQWTLWKCDKNAGVSLVQSKERKHKKLKSTWWKKKKHLHAIWRCLLFELWVVTLKVMRKITFAIPISTQWEFILAPASNQNLFLTRLGTWLNMPCIDMVWWDTEGASWRRNPLYTCYMKWELDKG